MQSQASVSRLMLVDLDLDESEIGGKITWHFAQCIGGGIGLLESCWRRYLAWGVSGCMFQGGIEIRRSDSCVW